MTKLSDLQLVLLSSAAARDNGSLLPPPESVAGQLSRIHKAIPPLLKRALVTEVEVSDTAQAWRQEDERHVGLFITDAGRDVIGAERPDSSVGQVMRSDGGVPLPVTAGGELPCVPTSYPTKSAQVLALLRREQGATLAELVEATGWLPHTTRAALTGLRKKGHGIAKAKRDEVTCYHLGEAA